MQHTRIFYRTASALLAIVLALSLAACGGQPSSDSVNGGSSSDSSTTSQDSTLDSQPQPADSVKEPDPIQEPAADLLSKINNAYNQNNDVVGWLSIDGTDINDYVIQGEDNSTYLRSDITKTYNWYGCYYADMDSKMGDRNSLSQNTIIYGHNMTDLPNDIKFAQLMKYLDPEFAASHPYINFSTPEDEMVWKVFSVMYTDTKLPFVYTEFPAYYPHGNPPEMEFIELIGEMRDRSIYDYDVDVNADDKILTLSTCTYKYGERPDVRYLVVARLVRPGESTGEKTVKIAVNENVKNPELD